MISALLLAACGGLVKSPSSESSAERPPPAAHAPAPRWVRAQGTGLVDESGAAVHLAGVVASNEIWGRWIWPRSDELAKRGDDPLIRDRVQPDWVLGEADFARLGALPINVARYEISHELFADDNPARRDNGAKLKEHVRRFAALGIGVIVDLNMPIGLDGQSDNVERKKPGSLRERSLFEDDELFAATIRTWTFVAEQLSSEPTLVAYEIWNEPRAPSDADGGVARFQSRSEQMARALRAVDPRHLVLVPEYHSREANPGESYPAPNGQGSIVDRGEQGIRWDRGLVKVSVENVGYVFHHYEPWSFTAEGAADFAPTDVAGMVLEHVRWRDEVGRAPLVVTEYGINRRQPLSKRVAWLTLVHDLLVQHDIGGLYFNYKAAVGPWNQPGDMMALYGQFIARNEVGSGGGSSYALRSDAAAAAEQSGFTKLFAQWFENLGPNETSLLDNESVVDELRRFAERRR